MAMYKVSLLGLYNFDNSLFEQITMPVAVIPTPGETPQAFYSPDKDTLISLILEKSAEFPALYPDWDFMHFMCGVWSKNCAYMMQTLWDQRNANVNPIENYDRHSTITRSSQSNAGGTVVAAQTAFNSDSFKDTGKSTSNETAGGTETVTDYTHGNIGVRSGQELQAQTREMAIFKWYDIVSDDFINKFCVQIY